MKASAITGPLLFLLSAAPLCAHDVFVPLPRNPSGGALEYKVKILATNQGFRPRRFQVTRVFPEPFGPPRTEKLADREVPGRTTGIFELVTTDEFSGLLRVNGASQFVIGALLEVRENGKLVETVSLPVATQPHGAGRNRSLSQAKHGDSLDHRVHVQGLAASQDGSITSDLTLVNFDRKEAAECRAELFSATGSSVALIRSLQGPAGAAAIFDNVIEASLDPEQQADVEDIRAQVDCEQETFYVWAAVYRDGGRDVVFLTPSVPAK